MAIAKLLQAVGIGQVVLCDREGVIHRDTRTDNSVKIRENYEQITRTFGDKAMLVYLATPTPIERKAIGDQTKLAASLFGHGVGSGNIVRHFWCQGPSPKKSLRRKVSS